ncbi:MAG: DMT family transporter [Candidatus Shapirobacteria bacterium]
MTRQRKLAYLALLSAAAIWGAAPPIIKYTLDFVSPTTFLFYRFLFVSLILFPLVIKNIKILNFKYLLIGLIGTPINLLLFFEGIKRTSASEASILAVLSPLFVIAGGLFFLQEKLEKNEKIGLAIALVGITLTLIRPDLNHQHLVGNLLVLAGSLTWAVFTLGAKKFKLEPGLLTAISFLSGIFVVGPLTTAFQLPTSTWPGIIYMTVGGSVIAYWAYSYGVKQIEASEATLFTYLQPLLGLPLALIFLQESLAPLFLVGTLTIALGVIISELRR